MRVLIGAFGTRGDVQPMLALSEALVARGHTVSLAVPPSSLELARGVVPGAMAVGLNYEEISRRATTGSFRELMSTMPLVRAEVMVQLEALEGLAAEADVIVGSSVFTVGTLLGQLFRKPYVFFAFCPQIVPSGEHPNPTVRQHGWPRWLNRLSWVSFEWIWSMSLKGALARAYRARGLPEPRRVWSTVLGANTIMACDPELATAPADHEFPISQTGALFLRERGELSPEVSAFLERGPPPVYIGFGSMSDRDPRATTLRLLESVRRAGARALISRGWAGLSADEVPPEVLFIGAEPHGKLFPRCAAVVHHGGAGTTHAAARAGVPQVVMPQLLDQFYWAHRVSLAGIGPRSVRRNARDPEPLARAIRTCLEDAALRERARALGARMIPDGADHAAWLLEEIAGFILLKPGLALGPRRAH